jgi:hypothetical protein
MQQLLLRWHKKKQLSDDSAAFAAQFRPPSHVPQSATLFQNAEGISDSSKSVTGDVQLGKMDVDCK